MKIIENRSVGINSPAQQAQNSAAPVAAPVSEPSADQKPSFSENSALSASALSMRASQTALAGTERAYGLMTKLAETVQKFETAKVMTPLQNSVLQVAASIQRSYPHYAQRLRNFMGNIDMLTSEIAVIKRELGTGVKVQRQGIAKVLIAEQNKDAAAKRSYSPQDASSLTRGMNTSDAENLLARRPGAAELLQG